MATRFYLPATGAAAVSPAFHAIWDRTSEADRLECVTTKIVSSNLTKTFEEPATSGQDSLCRQYVSKPLEGAQTISPSGSSNIRGQARAAENDAAINGRSQFVAYVVSNDGSTVRGVLWAGDAGGTGEEWATTLTNRQFPRSTEVMTEVSAQDGDRLVFELGIRVHAATTGADQYSIRFGDGAGSDLPEDLTTTTDLDPWIELSDDLTFESGGASHSGATTSTYTVSRTTAGFVTSGGDHFGATASTYALARTTAAKLTAKAASASVYTLSRTTAGIVDEADGFLFTLALPDDEDLSSRLRTFECRRGRPFNLDRVEAGTGNFTLVNGDGAPLDPSNAASPYYGELLPLREAKLSRTVNNVVYPRFRGPVERYQPVWVPPEFQYLDIENSDAFETLANAEIFSGVATLTTSMTGTNNDLVFTAREAGPRGDEITVEFVVADVDQVLAAITNDPVEGDTVVYIAAPAQKLGFYDSLAGHQRGLTGGPAVVPVSFAAQGTNITITVATNGSGDPTSTATQIKNAMEADPSVMALISVALAPGNNGTGVVTVVAQTPLAGGKWPQELTGERITRVLDLVDWPIDRRAIDDGIFEVVTGGFNEFDHASALAHLQDVADSELGYIFISGAGDFVFHDGAHRSRETRSTVSQATFSDDGTGMAYYELEQSFDKDRIVNEVSVTPGYQGAVAQVSVDVASQDPPPDGFGRRTLSKQTLLVEDADALAIADTIVEAYKTPATRFERIVLRDVSADDAWLWAEGVLAREIGDLVTVRTNPPGHDTTLSFDCFIEAITDTGAPGLPWQVAFQLTPQSEAVSGPPGGGGAGALLDSTGDTFTLDSATLGVLG